MANYKTINTLGDEDAAYIAGLIDPEGTITLTRRHRNENRQICVAISSTEINLLEFVKSATGIGKITRKKTVKDHHNTGFTYHVSNRQALGLIEQIHPYLKSYKKLRADLVLRDYLRLTPRNGKYTKSLLEKRNRFVKAVLAFKANS